MSINTTIAPFTGPTIPTFASAGVLKMFLGCIFPQLTCTTQVVFLPESCTKQIGSAGETSTRPALHQAYKEFQKKTNKLLPQTTNRQQNGIFISNNITFLHSSKTHLHCKFIWLCYSLLKCSWNFKTGFKFAQPQIYDRGEKAKGYRQFSMYVRFYEEFLEWSLKYPVFCIMLFSTPLQFQPLPRSPIISYIESRVCFRRA